MSRKALLPLFAAVVIGGGTWLWFHPHRDLRSARANTEAFAKPPMETLPDGAAALSDPRRSGNGEQRIRDAKAALRARTEARRARPGEATIAFKDEESYRRFLERAAKEGIAILNKIDALHAVRVSTASLDGLANDWLDHAGDYNDIASNYLLNPPGVAPAAQERAARTSVPLGNNLLSFLGASGDTTTWGRGVTVAVIDSGIQSDTTFGAGRLTYVDVGLGTGISQSTDGGHGTAVASLVAGSAPDARGVAPAANIVGIRVADDTGQSDTFAVAQAIVAATDRGAQIINLSLGGYDTNAALENAIEYATSRGSVIVAAAGNDQAAQLEWPAADPRVISVGAVDAAEQQVIFSNSGPQLQITAPGYGVQTAWTDGTRVLMDGTSASAPIVAGSIAAIMSANPGMNATDAWKILQTYANDGGPAGADPDYGNGVVNLGWAMDRNNSSRVDTAVSSHYYDANAGVMDVVVQNRSGQGVSGLTLDISVNGATTAYSLAWMNPGAVQMIQVPVNVTDLANGGQLVFSSQLNNPAGVLDQVPQNNRKVSTLRAPTYVAPPTANSK